MKAASIFMSVMLCLTLPCFAQVDIQAVYDHCAKALAQEAQPDFSQFEEDTLNKAVLSAKESAYEPWLSAMAKKINEYSKGTVNLRTINEAQDIETLLGSSEQIRPIAQREMGAFILVNITSGKKQVLLALPDEFKDKKPFLLITADPLTTFVSEATICRCVEVFSAQTATLEQFIAPEGASEVIAIVMVSRNEIDIQPDKKGAEYQIIGQLEDKRSYRCLTITETYDDQIGLLNGPTYTSSITEQASLPVTEGTITDAMALKFLNMLLRHLDTTQQLKSFDVYDLSFTDICYKSFAPDELQGNRMDFIVLSGILLEGGDMVAGSAKIVFVLANDNLVHIEALTNKK